MNEIEAGIDGLIKTEGLDDFGRLLLERSWDEVPIWSRISRLGFMSSLPVVEQSALLVRAAVAHLGRVHEWLARHPDHPLTCAIVSITRWSYIEDDEPMPFVPCFWISTAPTTELADVRFRLASEERGAKVAAWLGPQATDYWILRPAQPASDPARERVYIAPRRTMANNILDVASKIEANEGME